MNTLVLFSVLNHVTTCVIHFNVYSLFILYAQCEVAVVYLVKYAHVFLLLISYAAPSAKNNDMLL